MKRTQPARLGARGSPRRGPPERLEETLWKEIEEGDGRGLRVAVIDSGITPGHPHVGPVEPGAAFFLGPSGRVVRGEDAADQIGHGTACAALIREILPRARLLPVRVFQDRLAADSRSVAAGVRWALERGAGLINLSLAALPGGKGAAELEEACREAARRGVAVIAARPPAGLRGKGAGLVRLPEVIAAGADPRCPAGRFFADRRRPRGFLASPYARRAPGVPRRVNFQGTSLAAARLSGFAGRILASLGPLPPGELRALLSLWAARAGEPLPSQPSQLGC